jgi:hypothetical protein
LIIEEERGKAGREKNGMGRGGIGGLEEELELEEEGVRE